MPDAVRGALILVVDDDHSVRRTLRDLLIDFGYRVRTAVSAEAALEAVAETAPDLLIADVHMAGMNGIDLCARLKRDSRTQFTPVVLLTSDVDRAARVAGLAAGADDFFGKPFDAEELYARVKSLLRIKVLQDDLETRTRLLGTFLGRYVSEAVLAEILARPTQHLAMIGEKRDLTILFCDLRGFTLLAESLDAQDVVTILNVYLGLVVDAVHGFGGTVDKFLGDGVMVIFGAPVRHEDDPLRAVRCAMTVQEQLKNVVLPGFPALRLQVGIGINTGLAVAGNIGSERRMDYTVIGRAVNLAQRLESMAGPGQVLIANTVYQQVKGDVAVREIGPLRLKGVREGVPAFDVLGLL